jgi:tetratricopeptide (TPR) repeat protein
MRGSVKSGSRLAAIACVLAMHVDLAAQSAQPEVSARITRLEKWLSAIEQHEPGAADEAVLEVNGWNQEQLRLIWIDVTSLVSLVREPDVTLFYVSELAAASTGPLARPTSPIATGRATQVLYGVSELRRLRAIAKQISPLATAGPENDILKRGAVLHADIAMLAPPGSAPRSDRSRPGPVGFTLLMTDGQQIGLQDSVSHWNMGRRLLDRVRPVDSKAALKTTPDPGSDDTVRRWYLAVGAFMSKTRRIEPVHFERALELFRDDPDVLLAVAAVHEVFAGVRTQAALRSMKVPRDVTFGVQSEGAELRLAEQLYKRALERKPAMVEARIRLGRVLGLRGRHQEAVEQLRQGQSAGEPLLRYYAHLFLGAEYEALGNGSEARRSYEQAAAVAPTAQSPLLGLSRVADRAGDKAAAREAVGRVLKLPVDDPEHIDPWWVYEVAHGRHVDQLFEDLRQRF